MTSADEERSRIPEPAVGTVDRRGVDGDEDLVVLRHRTFDVVEPEDVRWSVPVVDNRPHQFTFAIYFDVVNSCSG
jgi:hypothetical protein